jgi:hypothetical protein
MPGVGTIAYLSVNNSNVLLLCSMTSNRFLKLFHAIVGEPECNLPIAQVDLWPPTLLLFASKFQRLAGDRVSFC